MKQWDRKQWDRKQWARKQWARKQWHICVAAAAILGSLSPLWGGDSIIGITTVSDITTLTRKATDFAGASENAKLQAGIATFKLFTDRPMFTDAIDTERPAGWIKWISDGNGSVKNFFFLPVRDPSALQKTIESFCTIENTENGITKATISKGNSFHPVFYAIKYDSWIIFSDDPCSIPTHWSPSQIDEAKQLVGEQDFSFDFSMTLHVNHFPAEIRGAVFQQICHEIHRCLWKNRLKLGEELSESLLKKLAELEHQGELNDYSSPIDRFSCNLNWEERADTLRICLAATAATGSPLGKSLSDWGKPTSTVLGNLSDTESLFSSQVSISLPFLASREAHALSERYLKEWFHRVQSKVASPELAETIEKFVSENVSTWPKAFLGPNLEEIFQVALPPDDFLVLWGRTVPESAVLEKQFQQLLHFIKEHLNDDLRAKILESGTEVDGELRIYYASIALPEKNTSCSSARSLRKVCGTSIQGCMVFAPHAIYYSVGKNAKKELLTFLKSNASHPATVPVLQWNFSLRRILEWIALHGHKDAIPHVESALKKMGDVGDGTLSVKLVPVANGVGIEFLGTPSAIRMLRGL